MFMMTTVFDLLHTTKCSGFLGSRITLLTVMSVPAVLPRDLKVFEHSVVFIFQIYDTKMQSINIWGIYRISKVLVFKNQISKKMKTDSEKKIIGFQSNTQHCHMHSKQALTYLLINWHKQVIKLNNKNLIKSMIFSYTIFLTTYC